MNTRSRVNGDDSGQHALTGGAAAQAASTGSGQAQGEPHPPVKHAAAKAPKHDPAFTPPQSNPAVPRDEHHGKGGMYVMVDGKRVPADEDGNPLPAKK